MGLVVSDVLGGLRGGREEGSGELFCVGQICSHGGSLGRALLECDEGRYHTLNLIGKGMHMVGPERGRGARLVPDQGIVK